MCNKLGQISQGWKEYKVANTCFFVAFQDITQDCRATYCCAVCDIRLQNQEINCVRLIVNGDKIEYPGVTNTPTADLTTIKNFFNSVISTDGYKCMCMDVKYFYLNTPIS